MAPSANSVTTRSVIQTNGISVFAWTVQQLPTAVQIERYDFPSVHLSLLA